MDEIKEMLKAIVHNQELTRAEIDGLKQEMNKRFDSVDSEIRFVKR